MILGRGVAVCCLFTFAAHRAVIFTIVQISCFYLFPLLKEHSCGSNSDGIDFLAGRIWVSSGGQSSLTGDEVEDGTDRDAEVDRSISDVITNDVIAAMFVIAVAVHDGF